MATITINIDPVLGHLGPLTLRWYGVIMAIAVIVGALVFARQLGKRGISRDHVVGMAIVAVPAGIVGARLFHILDDFGFYWHHPGQLWTLQLIGLAIYGVLTGGVLAIVVYCRRKKLPVWRVLDCLALAIPVGQIVGKCANIVNGDTWGYPTKLPWGIVYRNPNALLPTNLLGVPTQPTPIYEQLWLLVMIAILLWAMPRLETDGMAFLLYLDLYSFGRFFISFERVNNLLFLGLREAQLLALVVFVAVFPVAFWLRRRARADMAGSTPAGGRSRAA
ncbi:MAG: prolipoprotein diacylglyceryl transferase [Thermoleophilia bacterium]